MLAGRTVAQRFVAPARRCSGAVPASRMVGSRTKIDANPTSVPTINSIRFPPTAPAAEGSKAFSANIVGKASYTDADSSGYFQWASIATSAAVATLVAAAAAAAAATVSAVKGQNSGMLHQEQSIAVSKLTVTDHYELGDLLGEGGYASVRMATRKCKDDRGRHDARGYSPAAGTSADGEDVSRRAESDSRAMEKTPRDGGESEEAPPGCVAIKTVDKAAMDRDEFLNEFAALKAIHAAGGHPNIAGMEDMFEDERYYYLVLELVSGGELFEHLITNGAYSEKTAATILSDLADALRFLHRKGIVHADLKPENLMLSSWDDLDAKVKLVDFGCSRGSGLESSDVNIIKRPNYVNGTPAYWPPELVTAFDEGVPYTFDEAADMWAMGVVMFIMLVGSHPFDLEGVASEEQILRRASDPKVSIDEGATAHLSASALDLMRRLMEKDPSKRLTAEGMLRHPWTTGEQASGLVMKGVGEKLAAFQEVVRAKLESGLFAMLVQRSCQSSGKMAAYPSSSSGSGHPVEAGDQASVEDAVDVIRQAFRSFDKEGKGFVDARDISRVLKESGEIDMSEEDAYELDKAVTNANRGSRGVSMESFEQMMSSLENVSFERGDVVFTEGDAVESSPFMYVLGRGKVDLLKQVQDGVPPAKLASLSGGDIFGESALIDGGTRSVTVRCATPVQAVRIGKDSLGRMMKGSKSASANLREMSILRDISRAKSLLRAVGNITKTTVPSGQIVVKQGDLGDSMYTVVEGRLEVRVNQQEGDSGLGRLVATLSVGDVFGEMALMLKRPRSATVVCTSPPGGEGTKCTEGFCVLNEIKGEDFARMLKQSDSFQRSMNVILRTRLFRRAMLRLAAEGVDAFSKEKLQAVFDRLDADHSQSLDAKELNEALRCSSSELTEEDVQALMGLADLDRDGSISFEEFCRILRWDSDDDRQAGGHNDHPASPR